jgi:hypothetical protein
MQIQDLKWWAWAIIGLVVGLGMSYAYSNWDRSLQYPAGNKQNFQRWLLRVDTRYEGNPPVITDITLHPTVDEKALRVTYSQLDTEKQQYIKYEFTERQPVMIDSRASHGTEYGYAKRAPDIRTYLEAVKAANPDSHLSYQWAFWEEHNWTYIIFTTACVLIIGVAWPILLRLLVGAGFGRPPKPEDEYDLSRFGQGGDEAVAATAERDPAAEEADLAAVTAAYEARIGKGVDEDEEIESAIAEAQATSGAPIRQLRTGSAAEEISAKQAQEDEDREYAGEFYPVARPAHHKDEHEKK